MSAYEPLDLSSLYNAGLDILGAGAHVPLGSQTLRGLTFQLSEDAGKCLVAGGGQMGGEKLEIAVGKEVRWLIQRRFARAFPLGPGQLDRVTG